MFSGVSPTRADRHMPSIRRLPFVRLVAVIGGTAWLVALFRKRSALRTMPGPARTWIAPAAAALDDSIDSTTDSATSSAHALPSAGTEVALGAAEVVPLGRPSIPVRVQDGGPESSRLARLREPGRWVLAAAPSKAPTARPMVMEPATDREPTLPPGVQAARDLEERIGLPGQPVAIGVPAAAVARGRPSGRRTSVWRPRRSLLVPLAVGALVVALGAAVSMPGPALAPGIAPLAHSGSGSPDRPSPGSAGSSATGAGGPSGSTPSSLVGDRRSPSASSPTPSAGAASPGSSSAGAGRSPSSTRAPSATARPKPTATPAPVVGFTGGHGRLVIDTAHLARLPTSGASWSSLVSWANGSGGSPDIADMNDSTDISVLAKGLVYARTGKATYRDQAIGLLKRAVGTERGGATLALGRNLPGYVIAADLVGLRTADPSFDRQTFRPWLRSLLTESLNGLSLRSTNERRPNNWGTMAGAARVAVARYLGDSAELSRAARVFHGWLGDRAAYAGFSWGELAWQCDPAHPVGINRAGCSRDGIAIGGALPEEMRRGGTLQWPPAVTGYPWEALQGAVLEAVLLEHAGYPVWSWEDRALERAVRFLVDRARWLPSGDDSWQPFVTDAVYATHDRASAPSRPGKNFGFSDWLYWP